MYAAGGNSRGEGITKRERGQEFCLLRTNGSKYSAVDPNIPDAISRRDGQVGGMKFREKQFKSIRKEEKHVIQRKKKKHAHRIGHGNTRIATRTPNHAGKRKTVYWYTVKPLLSPGSC